MDKKPTTLPEPASEVTSAEQARLRTRRQFVKGTSLALPAVLTLHAQTAQAMVSVTCGQKAQSYPLPGCKILSSSRDGYKREACDVYGKNTPTYWPSGKLKTVTYGTTPYYYKDSANVWRYCSDNTPVSSQECGLITGSQTVKYIGNKCGTHYALGFYNVTDGGCAGYGMPQKPKPDCFCTSAAGLCTTSLGNKPKV